MMNKKVNFDDYSSDYLDIMNQQHSKYGDIEYYSKHKADIVKKILLNKKIINILEFGCGIGRNLPFLKNNFKEAKIYGSDISNESLSIAKKNNINIEFIYDIKLDDYKNHFDLIFIAGVYHHIEPKLRDEVTKRVVSLLKKDGFLICFEHNPYNPLTRHMVNTCEFDKDAVLLKKGELQNIFTEQGLQSYDSAYTLFVPPKLKKINFIEPLCGWLPLGGQYYIVMKK